VEVRVDQLLHQVDQVVAVVILVVQRALVTVILE
jgi:hypothetical protein